MLVARRVEGPILHIAQLNGDTPALPGTDADLLRRGLEAGKTDYDVVDTGIEILEGEVTSGVAQDFLNENVAKKQTRQHASGWELSLGGTDLNLERCRIGDSVAPRLGSLRPDEASPETREQSESDNSFCKSASHLDPNHREEIFYHALKINKKLTPATSDEVGALENADG